MLAQVPHKFEKLRTAPPLSNPTGVEHKGKQGIYAFKVDGEIVHIGRTRNLQRRMRDHRTKDHNKASFAFKQTRKETGRSASYKKKGSRADLLTDPIFSAAFAKNIEAVKGMEVHFVEITSHELQYLVEMYACIEFGLSTDEFNTS